MAYPVMMSSQNISDQGGGDTKSFLPIKLGMEDLESLRPF
jgi:hypothetical protein